MLFLNQKEVYAPHPWGVNAVRGGILEWRHRQRLADLASHGMPRQKLSWMRFTGYSS